MLIPTFSLRACSSSSICLFKVYSFFVFYYYRQDSFSFSYFSRLRIYFIDSSKFKKCLVEGEEWTLWGGDYDYFELT